MGFPTSVDVITNPAVSDKLNSPSHSALHTLENAVITALANKLGTGASTASAGTVLHGTGIGTSAWAQVDPAVDIATMSSATLRALLTDETGAGAAVFANTPSLISPAITGGGTWTGAPVFTGAELVGGVIEANIFIDESAPPKNVVLPDSREFRVLDKLQIASGFSLKIPATSSLQIETAPFTNSFSTANHTHSNAAGGGLIQSNGIAAGAITTDKVTASGCAARLTTTQALTTGVTTVVTFDAEDYDTDGYHSTTVNNSRMTAVTAGIYLVTGNVAFASNATSRRYIWFTKNGGGRYGQNGANAVSGDDTTIASSSTLILAVGDYVEIIALQISGGNLNLLGDSSFTGYTYFTITRQGG